MAEEKKAPVDIMDVINYVKLISPPAEGGETPWFTSVDEGINQLWVAVQRLELVVHHGKTSKEVGGALLTDGSEVGGPLLKGEAVMVKNPPPPPPPPKWHHQSHK